MLKDNAKWLTKKVNEKLPGGTVSEDQIGKWLRDALSDPIGPSHSVPAEPATPTPAAIAAKPPTAPTGPELAASEDDDDASYWPTVYC